MLWEECDLGWHSDLASWARDSCLELHALLWPLAEAAPLQSHRRLGKKGTAVLLCSYQ